MNNTITQYRVGLPAPLSIEKIKEAEMLLSSLRKRQTQTQKKQQKEKGQLIQKFRQKTYKCLL
jgi:hypothetical protein